MKYPRMLETHPLACKENQILGDHYRFTVLTESLVRMEYSPSGHLKTAPPRWCSTAISRPFPLTPQKVKKNSSSSPKNCGLAIKRTVRLLRTRCRCGCPDSTEAGVSGKPTEISRALPGRSMKSTARANWKTGSFRCAAAPRWTTARAWYSPTTVLSPLAPTKNRTSTFSGMAHPSTKD